MIIYLPKLEGSKHFTSCVKKISILPLIQLVNLKELIIVNNIIILHIYTRYHSTLIKKQKVKLLIK